MKAIKAVMGGVLPMLLAGVMTACGGKGGEAGAFPKNFNSLSDEQRVAYVMENASPDSVARFICLAALGKVPGARIDTLATASLYAYEHYSDSTLTIFSDEFDRFSSSLPLPDRMRIIAQSGLVDPQGLGYELGLHYVDRIRESRMTPAQVKEEIEALRKACKDDPKTFTRFLTGFKTVLKLDRGKDLDAAVYDTFINYE
ncbi:MAG: polysaccharide deacetylase family protein [Muribaculaceae bacterium]|nr:polysaccharide deacetylase family protein [Muribaculaceae bacterium]